MRFLFRLTKNLASLTYQDAMRRGLITPFLVFISFLASFGLARLIAYTWPSANLIIGKYHIHHFYYGIGLLIISNWVALVTNKEILRLASAVSFGVGLGILADEIGLLLTCTSPLQQQCNYYARITVDFFTIAVAMFLSVLYMGPVMRRFRRVVLGTHMFFYRRIRE